MLSELMDSDEEKPTRGRTRPQLKKRSVSGYFINIIHDLMIEYRMGLEEIFQLNVEYFEFL